MLVIPPSAANLRQTAQMVNQLAQGRNNAVFTVTLDAGAAATVVVNEQLIVEGGAPFFTAATATAAAEIASGNFYVGTADITPGQFIINHTNNAVVDRTFHYIFLGG